MGLNPINRIWFDIYSKLSKFCLKLKKFEFCIPSLMFGGRREEMILTETLRLPDGNQEYNLSKPSEKDLLAIAISINKLGLSMDIFGEGGVYTIEHLTVLFATQSIMRKEDRSIKL